LSKIGILNLQGCKDTDMCLEAIDSHIEALEYVENYTLEIIQRVIYNVCNHKYD
jgi:hypothetical protein